jgi:hypothetical protein
MGTAVRFRGDVYKAGQLYLSGVTGSIQQPSPGSDFLTWSGSFVVPGNACPPPGDDYELRLDDGRSGAMRILVVTPNIHLQPVAHFELNGPLQ